MPIRILHCVDSLGRGGLENTLVNLIEHLGPPRFEHIVCAVRRLGPHAERLQVGGVSVVCLDKDATGSRFQMRSLARVIRQFRPAIVHSRNWAAVEAVVAGRWAGGCAVVHSEHGILTDSIAGESWRKTCFRRLAYELADRVVSVSDQLRTLQAGRTRFPASKITVIHNGVDTSRFFPNAMIRNRMRQELALADDEFCIGCVGNLFPIKDHMTLLAAIKELAASCQSWRLLLVGEGPERSRLEAFISGERWRHRVQFIGSSPHVAELLQAMDVYVLPSLSEGISNSLLEAMATGLPVVVTATGGNPEVVVDGDSGLLFPVGGVGQLAETLKRLHAESERRGKFAQNALRRIHESFSLDAMVGKYADLYVDLVPQMTVQERMATEG